MDKPKARFLRSLFDRHGSALQRFLASRFHDEEDAADIAQEAWLRLQRLEHPEELANARAFLFQTAANLAVDHLRRVGFEQRHFGPEDPGGESQPESTAPSVEHVIDVREQLQIVEEAIAELPENCRQAFVMHRTRELTYPEIARELGVSVSMVEKHVIAALKHCRRRLEQRNRAAPARAGMHARRNALRESRSRSSQ